MRWNTADFDNSNFMHSFAVSKSIPLKQSNYLILKKLSVMSNLKTYFKNVVSVCKKGFAYVKVVPVLIKAVYQRLNNWIVLEESISMVQSYV